MSLTALSPTDAHAFLKTKIGERITLTSDYMAQKAGSEWFIKSVNILGGTCVIAVSPATGPGKGFFAPYKMFNIDRFVVPEVEPEPAVEAPADLKAPLVEAPSLSRDEFTLDDFDTGSPVYELFAEVAPDSDSARELFVTYVMEHSEFDTEPLEDLMRSANITPHAHWSDVNVTQMLMLLNEARESVDNDIESPEEAPGVDEPQQDVPPATPAVFIHPDVKPLNGPDPAPPKRRGRPPGSKNKVDPSVTIVDLGHFPGPEPTPQPAIRAVPAAELTAALDNVPVAAEIREVLPAPKSQAVFAPSPVALDLAAKMLPVLGVDENPEMLLGQVVGIVRRALMLDD